MALRQTPSSLPRELTSFVSRLEELGHLEGLLKAHRLVTVLGTYGVGKSRLALHLAWLNHSRGARVVYCDLANVSEIGELDEVLDVGLPRPELNGPGPGPNASPQDPGPETLVVLDNLEHLATSIAPLLRSWLVAAPLVRLVITSRERLRVPEEVCLHLGPLDEPDAVELLVHRARALIPELSVDGAARGALGEICQQLEGVPLAIEMTAPWLQVLSPSELAVRLRRGLALHHDGVPSHRRHASIESAIAWSWDLLSIDEREFMIQASVFRGQFTYEDAMAVIALPDQAPSVLTLLRRLRERSLLMTHRQVSAHRVDFSMGQAVRGFVASRRANGSAVIGLAARHRARILSLAGHHLAHIEGPDGPQHRRELSRLRPDLLQLRGDYDAPTVEEMIRRALEVQAEVLLAPDPETSRAAEPIRSPGPEDKGARLLVHERGDWLRLSGGPQVSLARRGPVRQILLGLIERSLHSPGEPMSMEGVCELGWPGEKMSPEAAANRVYAAISTLRRFGLGALLTTRQGGWFIQPGAAAFDERSELSPSSP